MYCDFCGKELKKDAVYCRHCGEKVNPSSADNLEEKLENTGIESENGFISLGFLSSDKGRAEYYLELANEAYEKDEIREAIEYYSYAIKYDPESSTSYCNRGFMKAELGKHKEAIKDYNSALKIDPSFTLPLYHKGRSLYFLENYQESLKIFEKLLEEEPNDKELQFYVNDLKKLI